MCMFKYQELYYCFERTLFQIQSNISNHLKSSIDKFYYMYIHEKQQNSSYTKYDKEMLIINSREITHKIVGITSAYLVVFLVF